METPSDVVRSYIADYNRWNQSARARMQQAGGLDAADLAAVVRSGASPADIQAALQARQRPSDMTAAAQAAEREFATLLGPYYAPGAEVHSGPVNDPPLHDPAREEVRSESRDGDRCVVRTELVQHFGTAVFALDYEYHLCKSGSRWLIERVIGPPDGGRPIR